MTRRHTFSDQLRRHEHAWASGRALLVRLLGSTRLPARLSNTRVWRPARAESRHARRSARRATPRRSARRPSWATRLPCPCSAPRTARAPTAPAHASPAGAARGTVGAVHALHVQGGWRACGVEGSMPVCHESGLQPSCRMAVVECCMQAFCVVHALVPCGCVAAPSLAGGAFAPRRAALGPVSPARAQQCLCLVLRLRWGG